MKTKLALFTICLCGLSFFASAQQYVNDKKATIISGTGSFINQGGDLFEDYEGNKATTITFNPNINHFIAKRLFVGGGIDISTDSQGDYKSNSIGIGPQLGYVFGGPQSKALPYLDLGIRYYNSKTKFDYGSAGEFKTSGTDIFFGFGVIVPLKEHIGLVFEGGYHMLDLKSKETDETYSGNLLSIGVGIAGLLFQNAE